MCVVLINRNSSIRRNLMCHFYVFKDVFPVSEVLLDTYKWKKTDKSDKDIIVDESMQVLKISVMGGIRVTDVDFINKKG